MKKYKKSVDIRIFRDIINEHSDGGHNKFSAVGVDGVEGPPVPIPNTVVKLNRADNTRRAASRKDRAMPTQANNHSIEWLFFYE